MGSRAGLIRTVRLRQDSTTGAARLTQAKEQMVSMGWWRRASVVACALLVVGAALLVPAALAGHGPLLVLAVTVVYAADWLLERDPDDSVRRWLAARQAGREARALLRESFAALGWVVATRPAPGLVVLVLVGVALVHLAHAGVLVVGSSVQALDRGRIAWRNLEVSGASAGPPAPTAVAPGLGRLPGEWLVLCLDLLVLAGMLAATVVERGLALLVADLLVAGAVAWLATRALARWREARRRPPPAAANAMLRAALEGLSPSVAVYFSGGRDTAYQLNVWLETLARLRQPTVLLLREAHHLGELLPHDIPTVVLPRAQDVELFTPESVLVALYPTTVIKNNHMVRLPDVRHVFINHGDGDKSVTYSPLHRVFDEIWVAGQAACDRYLTRGEGVRAEQLVQVGRPQLAHIARADPNRRPASGPFTVLYAPTWEGNFDGVDYSSVAGMGERIVAGLLAHEPRVRVLFKAHPATGSRLARARAARQRIEAMLRDAPGGHAVVAAQPGALYEAFNDADLLLADISSVVADFLVSRKPYLVTNPTGADLAEFHQSYPSARAAGVLGPDVAELDALLADAMGPDTARAARERLATYFLGEPVADPIGRFAAEVDRARARAAERRTRRYAASLALAGGRPGSRAGA